MGGGGGGGSGGWSDEARGAIHAYWGLPLAGFAHWVLAGRVAGAASGGSAPKLFALGGQFGGGLSSVPGLALVSRAQDFPLRGYPLGASQFTRVVVTTAELRIPVLLIGKGIPKLPLALDRISVTLFGEAGGGWLSGEPRQLAQYRDLGGELVADLGLNLDSPLSLRVGAARALTPGLGAASGDWRGYVALGSPF